MASDVPNLASTSSANIAEVLSERRPSNEHSSSRDHDDDDESKPAIQGTSTTKEKENFELPPVQQQQFSSIFRRGFNVDDDEDDVHVRGNESLPEAVNDGEVVGASPVATPSNDESGNGEFGRLRGGDLQHSSSSHKMGKHHSRPLTLSEKAAMLWEREKKRKAMEKREKEEAKEQKKREKYEKREKEKEKVRERDKDRERRKKEKIKEVKTAEKKRRKRTPEEIAERERKKKERVERREMRERKRKEKEERRRARASQREEVARKAAEEATKPDLQLSTLFPQKEIPEALVLDDSDTDLEEDLEDMVEDDSESEPESDEEITSDTDDTPSPASSIPLPESGPSSPYEVRSVTEHFLALPLPESPLDSPTRPYADYQLPVSCPSSPYQLPEVPLEAQERTLPESPIDSPTKPYFEYELPPSRPESPYQLPEVEEDAKVIALPDSPVESPTKPYFEYDLPVSRPESPYELPAVPREAVEVQLPESPVESPTKPYFEYELPISRPGSPYTLPEVDPTVRSIPLPESPFNSPTIPYAEYGLPESRPGSPYQLPPVPVDLPKLPESSFSSPTLLPQTVDLPSSRPGSPYQLPEVEEEAFTAALPESSLSSPTLLPHSVELPESAPGSPYILPAVPHDLPELPLSPIDSPTLPPQSVELPESHPGSPYTLPEIPKDLPALPESGFNSPTLLPETLELPDSRPGSPYSLPLVDEHVLHVQLPESSFSSPTLLPQTVDLPISRPNSPYSLAVVEDLPALPPSSFSSPTLLPSEVVLPASTPNSPYVLPEVPKDLPELPESGFNSPTVLPETVSLPGSRPESPYQLPEVPEDLPELPLSSFSSPTQLPKDVYLPESRPDSPYQLPEVPLDLPELPLSSVNSPTLLPETAELPHSRPGSPYQLPEIPVDLPELPQSAWNSPTLLPETVNLPISRPGSPYALPEVSETALEKALPASPWDSPTLGPKPMEAVLPASRPGSPYVYPEVEATALETKLPGSPWNSPTLGPRPTDLELPGSRPESPYQLPDVPGDLPFLPASPWNSPTLGPRPTEKELPESRPESPYMLPAVEDAVLEKSLPESPWDSPTLGPKPMEVDLPSSRPNSPYQLPAVPVDLPQLPGSPWDSPTDGVKPQDLKLPGTRPGSPYQLPEIPRNLPALPGSPWFDPTDGVRPQETDLPVSNPASPYQLPTIPDDLPELPLSPWDDPTDGFLPQELSLPNSAASSPYQLPAESEDLPDLDPWHDAVEELQSAEFTLPSNDPTNPFYLPKVPRTLSPVLESPPSPAPAPTAPEEQLDPVDGPPPPHFQVFDRDRDRDGDGDDASDAGSVASSVATMSSSQPGKKLSKTQRRKLRYLAKHGVMPKNGEAEARGLVSAANEEYARAVVVSPGETEVVGGVGLMQMQMPVEGDDDDDDETDEEEVLMLRRSRGRSLDKLTELEMSDTSKISTELDSDRDEQQQYGVAISDEVNSVHNLSTTLDTAFEPTTNAHTATVTELTEDTKDSTPFDTDSEAESDGETKRPRAPAEEDVNAALEDAIATAFAINPSADIRPYTPLHSPPPQLRKKFTDLLSQHDTTKPAIEAFKATLDLPSLEARAFSNTQESVPFSVAKALERSAIEDILSSENPEKAFSLGITAPEKEVAEVSVEADPGFEVTFRKVSGESDSSAAESLEVQVEKPRGRLLRDVLSHIPSWDNLRSPHQRADTISDPSVISSLLLDSQPAPSSPPSSHSRDQPRAPPRQSIFGGLSPDDDDDPFTSKSASSDSDESSGAKQFSLSPRRQSLPVPVSLEPQQARSVESDHGVALQSETATRPSFSRRPTELPTITEQQSQEISPALDQREFNNDPGEKILVAKRSSSASDLRRQASITSALAQRVTSQPAPPTSSLPAIGQRFISSEDIINRLSFDVPKRTRTFGPPLVHRDLPKVPKEFERMQVLKRGERHANRQPSLRRVGSELHSAARVSSEHVIFGDRISSSSSVRSHGKQPDVLEAYGERAPTPNSPTRPPSIRRRQSLQIMDLENTVQQLATENTTLEQTKANLEKSLIESRSRHKQQATELNDAIKSREDMIKEKDSQLEELNKKLTWYREEVQRLTLHNDTLLQTNTALSAARKHHEATFTAQVQQKDEQYKKLASEHAELERQFQEMHTGVERILRNELQTKDTELTRLRRELDKAREDIRQLQRKVNQRQSDRYLDIKDFQHFVNSSDKLFAEVRDFCERFSNWSAGQRIVHVHRIQDDDVKERFENVMLDDRGVRRMLKDESRRGQVFTAMMMRMLWEFVFSRYLFGLDKEQRLRLLELEHTLGEVATKNNNKLEAVHQWRATTLTLLTQRPAFRQKILTDTHATAAEIMRHLHFILPPPAHHHQDAITALTTLVDHAVTLSIEMRTQRAEYVMQRAPRPEYDDNGEVSNTIPYDPAKMHAVNAVDLGMSEQDLADEKALVKMVMFPAIICRGNELGEKYDNEVVVKRMQVLVNRHQLRSESRASTIRSTSSTTWREQEGRKQHVNRLTPITDLSPRTTPEKARRDVSPPTMLPAIPEATIRLVEEERDVEMPDADAPLVDIPPPARPPPPPPPPPPPQIGLRRANTDMLPPPQMGLRRTNTDLPPQMGLRRTTTDLLPPSHPPYPPPPPPPPQQQPPLMRPPRRVNTDLATSPSPAPRRLSSTSRQFGSLQMQFQQQEGGRNDAGREGGQMRTLQRRQTSGLLERGIGSYVQGSSGEKKRRVE